MFLAVSLGKYQIDHSHSDFLICNLHILNHKGVFFSG